MHNRSYSNISATYNIEMGKGCNDVSLLLPGTVLEKVAHSRYVKSGSLSFVLSDPVITHGHESFVLQETLVTLNPIPPGLFEGGSAWGGGGGGTGRGGKCPRPITLKLLMIMK